MRTLCLCMLALVVVGCDRAPDTGSDTIRYTVHESRPEVGATTVDYETVGDRIRNLDVSMLQDTTIDDSRRMLLKNLWLATLEYDDGYIADLKATYRRAEDPFRTIYRLMLMELLSNTEDYSAIMSDSLVAPAMGNYHLFDAFSRAGHLYGLSRYDEQPGQQNGIQVTELNHVYLECEAASVRTTGLLDTGADLSIVSRSFAKRAGLQVTSLDGLKVDTPNGLQVEFELAFLPDLILGDVRVQNIPVLVFADENLRYEGRQTDLIIGWPVISKLRIEVDHPQRTYDASISPDSAEGSDNFFWLGYPGLKLTSGTGQSLLFGLDTGAGESNLKSAIGRKVELGHTRTDSIGDVSAGGVVYRSIETASDFSVYLDDLQITYPAIGIYDDKDFFFIQQDGTIGADIFAGNTVVIDYPNRHFDIVRE